ncbi:TRAM domain-containing protein, partial [Desulforamulus profundi]
QEEISSQTVPVKTGEIIELKVEEPHISNPSDGIARLDGFIIDVEGGGALVGELVSVEIVKVHRTYAKARLV